MSTDLHTDDQITLIRPESGWSPIDFSELWRHRELLLFLIIRDIKVKYKQTWIGIAWAVLQPLAAMIVFTVFFGRLAKIPSDGQPYEVFSYLALVPWFYFATALTSSSLSLVGNTALLTKVYFPRLLLPIGSSAAALVDLAVSLATLLVLLTLYGFAPSWRALWLPPLILLAFITALGFGFWLSAINVRYRDVQYTIPFLIQIWLFITPVIYPASLVPEGLRWLYGINPMVTVIEGFRWALTDRPLSSWPMMLISIMVSLTVFVSGSYYFRRTERDFADVV